MTDIKKLKWDVLRALWDYEASNEDNEEECEEKLRTAIVKVEKLDKDFRKKYAPTYGTTTELGFYLREELDPERKVER